MNTFTDWIKAITLFLIFSSIFETLVANETYKKYISTFSALILIILVVKPFVTSNWFEQIIHESVSGINVDVGTYSYIADNNISAITKGVGENIKDTLNNQDGKYNIINVDANLETNENSKNYGKINSLTVYYDSNKKEENNEIMTVSVNISQCDEENISSEIISTIISIYNLNENQINVVYIGGK